MKIQLNKPLLLILLITFCNCSNAQKKDDIDIWSGEYAAYAAGDSIRKEPVDTLIIQKIKNIDTSEEPSKYKSDPARWIIISKKNNNRDTVTVRRFLYDPEEGENEYEQFGWTDMHLKGKMNCIDAGHFFICQATPGTIVHLGKDESFLTTTGIFGVMLHYGLFELKKTGK